MEKICNLASFSEASCFQGKKLRQIFIADAIIICLIVLQISCFWWERSGSVVEWLTWDQGAVGSSLTGVTELCPWARHINPSLVLVQLRKTRPFITERLLMVHKESNKKKKSCFWWMKISIKNTVSSDHNIFSWYWTSIICWESEVWTM